MKKFDLQFVLAPGKPENFQDFSPTVLPKAAWKELDEVGRKEEAKQIILYYKENKYDVEAIMGKTHTDDEINRFLFGEGASGGVPSQSYTDVAAEIEKELSGIGSGEPVQAAPPVQPPPTPPPPPVSETVLTGDFDELLSS